MFDAILDLARQTITSPWIYLALYLFAAVDGFFPVVPGETLIVAASVFAASGSPNIAVIIGVSALGAFTGDHTSYFIGRVSIGRLGRRMRDGTRGRAAYDWAGRALAERGGQVLLASRYIPGVRTATTMTAGAVGYPLRFSTLFDSMAATFWAGGWALMGYLGGLTFKNEPVKGLLLGLGLAVAVNVLGETIRSLRRRSRRLAGAFTDSSFTDSSGAGDSTGDVALQSPERSGSRAGPHSTSADGHSPEGPR